jgi:hypothetical protein
MSKVYGEPVNVQARDDGRPVRFVWRGRLYTVRAILEHWVINREWWQDPKDPKESNDPKDPKNSDDPKDPKSPEPPGAEAGQPELEFWRIEAAPGPGMTAGAYELRREAATGAWTLRPGVA